MTENIIKFFDTPYDIHYDPFKINYIDEVNRLKDMANEHHKIILSMGERLKELEKKLEEMRSEQNDIDGLKQVIRNKEQTIAKMRERVVYGKVIEMEERLKELEKKLDVIKNIVNQ